jgi:hypothetical protein
VLSTSYHVVGCAACTLKPLSGVCNESSLPVCQAGNETKRAGHARFVGDFHSVRCGPKQMGESRYQESNSKNSPGSVRYPGEFLALEEQCILDTPKPLQTYRSVGLYSRCILSEKVAVISSPGRESESSHFSWPLRAFPPQSRDCAPSPSAASSGAERKSVDQSTRLPPAHSPPFEPSLLGGRPATHLTQQLRLQQARPRPSGPCPWYRDTHSRETRGKQRIPSRLARSR